MATSRLSHRYRGAPGSCHSNANPMSISTPACGVHRRAAARPAIRTTKRSSSVQRPTQVSGALSTPVATSSRHPGGRFRRACTRWKSCAHPVAGSCAPSPSKRLSAESCSAPRRTSTPSGPPSASRVMGCGSSSRLTRPSRSAVSASSRQLRVIEPEIRSVTVYPPPSKSSHKLRSSCSRSGSGSGSPRRRVWISIASPAAIRYAGRLCHSCGTFVCRGSMATGPSICTSRKALRGSKLQTSCCGQGSTASGSRNSAVSPANRPVTSRFHDPGRSCRRSRPSGSTRAGRGLSSDNGMAPGRAAPTSTASRGTPATRSTTRVTTCNGRSSTIRRKTSTSTRFSAASGAAAAAEVRSHS